jgi:polysaccharide export outer membrane protein
MTLSYRLASVAAFAVLASCSGTSQPAAAPPKVAAVVAAEGSSTAPAAPAEDAAAAAAPPEAAANAATGLPAPTAPPAPAAPAEDAAAAPAPAAPAGQATPAGQEKGKDGDTYVIGSGDQLNVFVYDSPQLSMTVPVRPDGRISTPLVPEMMAAGKTPSQLAQDLTERLKEFIKEPNVTVIVSGFVGPLNRQIRVIGEAAEPQAIPYRDHMTVLDVMIMAKGLTRFAAGNRAVIVRGEGDKQERIRVHLSDLLKEGDISQNVEMRPGDTLIIPQTWF